MSKYTLVMIGLLFTTLSANASLMVNCKTKQNGDVSAQLMFDGASVDLQVTKNKAIVHTTHGGANFDEKWNSITVDGTNQSSGELNGVKIYFEAARTENQNASIRPYGSTSETLFPGNEDTIFVVGLTCDQSFSAIQTEVANTKYF